jgi:hypothetical protein
LGGCDEIEAEKRTIIARSLEKEKGKVFSSFFFFGGIQDLNDDTHPGFSRVEKKVTPEGHPALLYLMTKK